MTEPTPIDRLLDAPAAARQPRPWWCPGCGAERPYGTTCESCRAVVLRRQREEGLAASYATIPGMFRTTTWGTVGGRVPARAIAHARAAADRFELQPRVVLMGRPGCGKTSLAVCMLRHVVDGALERDATIEQWRRARAVLFVDAHELAGARVAAPLGSEPALVRRCMTAGLLVLDELGGEAPNVPRSAVADVLQRRHREPSLWTIVTTGLTQQALGDLYGGGIVRRLFEGAECIRPEALL